MKSYQQSKGPSQRQLRVGEQIRHILAETMARGHFHFESLLDAGKITVSEVRISPDLKNATAYVMPLGGYDLEDILPALNQEAPVFQKEIGRQGNLKFTPRIKFVKDQSFDNVSAIDNILREIHIPEDDEDDGSQE
jgi:ribosome-binding factor A